MLEGNKYFELLETAKPPEIILAYKNWGSLFTYPTELANKGFTLSLAFNSTPIFINLSVLSDAFLGRRSHDKSLIRFNILNLLLEVACMEFCFSYLGFFFF